MKLDLILENIRNRYSLGILEESDSLTDIETLQAKMFINESTMMARKVLIDNGLMESTRLILEEAFVRAIEEMAPPVSPNQRKAIQAVPRVNTLKKKQSDEEHPLGYTPDDVNAIHKTQIRKAGDKYIPKTFNPNLRSEQR